MKTTLAIPVVASLLCSSLAQAETADSFRNLTELTSSLPFKKVARQHLSCRINEQTVVRLGAFSAPDTRQHIYDESCGHIFFGGHVPSESTCVEIDLRASPVRYRMLTAVPRSQAQAGVIYIVSSSDAVLLVNHAQKQYLRFERVTKQDLNALMKRDDLALKARLLEQMPDRITDLKQLHELCYEYSLLDKGIAQFSDTIHSPYESPRNLVMYQRRGQHREELVFDGGLAQEHPCMFVKISPQPNSKPRVERVDSIPKGDTAHLYAVFTPYSVLSYDFAKMQFIHYDRSKGEISPGELTSSYTPHDLLRAYDEKTTYNLTIPIESAQ